MDVLQSLIARPGQTQEARLPAGLAPHFVDVEERSAAELFDYLKRLAAKINFFDVDMTGAVAAAGDWTPFFDLALPGARDGATPPHLALLAAFLKLYRVPRCAMNGVTARHLDFFYRRVLGFAPRTPKPDHAHLLIELKNGAAPVEIGPQHVFSGGKDASGAERLYAPLDKTLVNQAAVKSLCSVYVDPADGGTVCFAPIANSDGGLGPAFTKDEPWPGLGGPQLPAAPIGFAVASPVLRMQEGTRVVSLALEIDGLDAIPGDHALEQSLECFVTGATRWLGPYPLSASRSGTSLTLSFTVPASDEAVADYDAAKHAHAFTARAPVVQVLLKIEDETQKPGGYRDFLLGFVASLKVSVDVSGVKGLQLQSDLGPLDPKRAFMPFGTQPVPGSRFLVGYPEALSKKLGALGLQLDWLGLPADFSSVYLGYENPPSESSVTASATFRDAAGRGAGATSYTLFQPMSGGTVTLPLISGAHAAPIELPYEPFAARRLRAYSAGGSRMLSQAARRELLRLPVFGFAQSGAPAPQAGFITLALDRDLGHTQYRSKLLAGTPLAHEPYTPTLAGITLSYQASSDAARIGSAASDNFASVEAQFFHVGCFGQRREHRWLREQLPFVDEKRVPLFPEYENEGELLVGLSALGAGDSASLLFKVSEGSADPDVDPQPEVEWAVLCDNYWKPLVGGDSVRDGTDDLLATGIVAVTIPEEAGTESTFLPAGQLWLRAAVQRDVRGVCALQRIAANAIEVQRSAGVDPAARLWTPLPQGTIARLKTPVAEVKSVTQPFATFDGTALESNEALDTRAAERLRHRARCITAWDYERTVLAAFPEVRKAKVVPHCAGQGGWLDPGHVTVIVIPDLRLRNAVDPLQPKADADTLRRIRELLEDRSGMGNDGRHGAERSPMKLAVHARNPRYQPIHLDFKVRFRPGVEFNYHARLLNEAIIDHLSPWRHDSGAAIDFGGTIYKSQLIDFVEDIDYVDFLTDFHMFKVGDAGNGPDIEEASADTPDAILVSDATHDIGPVADTAP